MKIVYDRKKPSAQQANGLFVSKLHKFAQSYKVDVGLCLGMPREIALMLIRRRLK